MPGKEQWNCPVNWCGKRTSKTFFQNIVFWENHNHAISFLRRLYTMYKMSSYSSGNECHRNVSRGDVVGRQDKITRWHLFNLTYNASYLPFLGLRTCASPFMYVICLSIANMARLHFCKTYLFCLLWKYVLKSQSDTSGGPCSFSIVGFHCECAYSNF